MNQLRSTLILSFVAFTCALDLNVVRPVAERSPSSHGAVSNLVAGVYRGTAPTLKGLANSHKKHRKQKNGKHVSSGGSQLESLGGFDFLVQINWNGDDVLLSLDTGSSDTWIATQDFQCIDDNFNPIEIANCALFPSNVTTFSGGQIRHRNFHTSYGDGDFGDGKVGYEDLTIAGVTAKKQIVALMTEGHMVTGVATGSGLLGLAYPGLTNMWVGDSPNNNPASALREYPPIIETIFKQNKHLNSVFSLALPRYGDKGYLAFGGWPPVPYSGDVATTPILMIGKERLYYTIEVPSIYIGKDGNLQQLSNSSEATWIVDSGTALTIVPNDIADALTQSYDPPAAFDQGAGLVLVDCKATAPQLGFEIGGTVFMVSPEDMIIQSTANDAGKCAVGYRGIAANDSGLTLYILGTTFLHNVLTYFDFGNSQIRFAQISK